MKIVLVPKCSLDIKQYVGFKISVLILPSKSLISSVPAKAVCREIQHFEKWNRFFENE